MLQHDNSLLLQLTGARRTPVFATAQTPSEMINSAFVTAYLLTGSAAAAEASVEEAIEEWEPPSGASALVRKAARAALPRQAGCMNDFPLPRPLRRVVELPECMRRCFILRCFVGLTAPATAQWLSLTASAVDQCTSDAIRSLTEIRQADPVRRSTTKV